MKAETSSQGVVSSPTATSSQGVDGPPTAGDLQAVAGPRVVIAPQVAEALRSGQPVVAMESTVYSSLGLPQPANLQAYAQATQAVESKGAVGVVTAVVEGEVKVGLTPEELSGVLGTSRSQDVVQPQGTATQLQSTAVPPQTAAAPSVRKVSLADLPIAVAQKWKLGATTVSASLAIAHQAGIKVFATGGIGGVHRENPDDVSADLLALSRYPVATVCSGAKAFLNLPATLERLETLGVAVVGYQTHQFPAFWSRESDLLVHHRVDTPSQAAEIVRQLGPAAVLFVVPPPADAALAWSEVATAAESALEEAKRQAVQGGAVTPFVLEQISQATGEKTLPANVALVANNAAVAAEIAVRLGDGQGP